MRVLVPCMCECVRVCVCVCVCVCQNDDECILAVQIFSGYRYLCGQSKIPCVVKCVYSQGKTNLVILLSGDLGFSYQDRF